MTRAKRIAVIGGGISGLAAAYELARRGVDFALFEASSRLGGTVETVRAREFVIECGPDSWVTEKPWARELAIELGLGDRIIGSNDRWRRTYLAQGGPGLPPLVPMPDGMRLMVPAKWGPLLESPLFSWQARLAYLREPRRAEELKAARPPGDESVAEFVRRHFGEEVTDTIAGPLLSGVFGGDIATLSVRSVMPAFVKMEAEQGSLIQGVQQRDAVQQRAQQAASQSAIPSSSSIFSSLSGGLGTLVEGLASHLPAQSIHLRHAVLRLDAAGAEGDGWRVATHQGEQQFSSVVLATPSHVTRELLQRAALPATLPNTQMAALLPQQASSAIIVALGFAPAEAERMRIPRGFGFLVPAENDDAHRLLACTFLDQKFPHCAPAGGVLLRAFFGGRSGDALQAESDDTLTALARDQLSRILGPLPDQAVTVVRRWPLSLPQYAVGHLDRIAQLESLVRTVPGLHLVGSAYHGVGLPDLIRDGRAAGRLLAES